MYPKLDRLVDCRITLEYKRKLTPALFGYALDALGTEPQSHLIGPFQDCLLLFGLMNGLWIPGRWMRNTLSSWNALSARGSPIGEVYKAISCCQKPQWNKSEERTTLVPVPISRYTSLFCWSLSTWLSTLRRWLKTTINSSKHCSHNLASHCSMRSLVSVFPNSRTKCHCVGTVQQVLARHKINQRIS